MWRCPLMAVPVVMVVIISFRVWVIEATTEPQVPCFFIFGDSLSDSGNNNGLMTLAKANFLPYGIDFPGGPTGRFTNGRTTVDLIGEHLGLESYIPPFATTNGLEILKGVNYASGSAGIRNETGQHVGDRIPMDKQLRNHEITISRIASILGNSTAGHLNKCLYSVYAGSNDYMINYYMPTFYSSSVTYTPEQYTDGLAAQYTRQLKRLYENGARKVVLFGLSPLGCLPPLLQQATNQCSDNINSALQLFNSKVKSLVDQFNKDLTDSKFIFVDTFAIVSEHLSALGKRMKNAPCCGVGQLRFCLPFTVPCNDRNGFAYWDNAHPTEAANKVLARRAYTAKTPNDTYPFDISTLVQTSTVSPGPGGTTTTPPSEAAMDPGGATPQGQGGESNPPPSSPSSGVVVEEGGGGSTGSTSTSASTTTTTTADQGEVVGMAASNVAFIERNGWPVSLVISGILFCF
ncbi:hypothetical protein Dimus_033098 [Dionaea muscipula]